MQSLIEQGAALYAEIIEERDMCGALPGSIGYDAMTVYANKAREYQAAGEFAKAQAFWNDAMNLAALMGPNISPVSIPGISNDSVDD